ncbi:hypothetical protein A2U01_0076259, partial [Trifolium medium]|nr:hypothetical protein [Trifolium medium]
AETNQSVPADTKVDESKVENTTNQHNTTQDDTAAIEENVSNKTNEHAPEDGEKKDDIAMEDTQNLD